MPTRMAAFLTPYPPDPSALGAAPARKRPPSSARAALLKGRPPRRLADHLPPLQEDGVAQHRAALLACKHPRLLRVGFTGRVAGKLPQRSGRPQELINLLP